MPRPKSAGKLSLQEQVAQEVRGWIDSGKYGSGEQLPTAREISVLCGGINEQTVRRAVKGLIEEGLLVGAQGKGVFVDRTGAKHSRVALVLPNLEDQMTVRIAKGVQSVLDRSGMQLLILDAQRNSEKEKANIVGLPDLPVDGAIIFPIVYSDMSEKIFALKQSGFPLVLVDKDFAGICVDTVLADDYGGSYALTQTLLKRGYKHFVWIGGEAGASTVEARLEGMRWALGDNGIAVPRSSVLYLELPTPSSPFQQAIDEQLGELLQSKKKTDVIVCSNDLVATGVVDCLRRKGVRVPEDIGVCGFDGLEQVASGAVPELTTVRKSIEQMGVAAAESLLSRILQRNALPRRITVPTEVILGRSA